MTEKVSRGLSERVSKLSRITAVVWTAMVLGLFLRDIATIRETSLQMAQREAAAHFNMDWSSRLWATSHGGVYVPVSEKTAPNPFLKNVPERDIVTPSGRYLTLMNPAYMIRQMMEHYSDLYGVLGHITSLKPLRDETSPDDWERSVLVCFEQGVEEVGEVVQIEGQPFFRLMKPLVTEEGCLKCHGNQGYRPGDIRGGLSVSVPLGPYFASQKKEILTHSISFSILWLLGLTGIFFFGRKLQRHAQEQQKTEELYTTVVENSLTGIYIIQKGKIVFANQRFADIYGYSRKELMGMDSLDLAHPEDRPLIGEMRQRRVEGRGAPEEYEARGLRKGGEVIWVQRRNSLILYEGETAILGNVLDVTALKEAETTLKSYARELEQKNAELDQFASIASHDLKEPLRKVRTFTELLMSKCRQGLDDPGRDYMRRTQKAAVRMETLIDSLLAFSRITTKARPLEKIDLNDVVKDALSDLEVRIAETEAVVETGNLPAVRADRMQMVQLFENLIGNALKFHRRGVPPQIKISSSEKNSSLEICIQDNGIGFDEKYLGRIFSPFERLHGKEQYEGVGMGLAICMKIVERHGGTITARSQPGEGSLFVVRLPKSIDS